VWGENMPKILNFLTQSKLCVLAFIVMVLPALTWAAKPSVPLEVTLSLTDEGEQGILLHGTVSAMADLDNAEVQIFAPDEAHLIAGDAIWRGNLSKGSTRSFEYRFELREPIVMWPVSFRLLATGYVGSMRLSRHAYAHYHEPGSERSFLNEKSQPRLPPVRAGAVEFRGP
jgi:hypothetical protein